MARPCHEQGGPGVPAEPGLARYEVSSLFLEGEGWGEGPFIERDKRTEIAHKLRRGSTVAEAHLWRRLRNRQFSEHKWRRQEPIGRYFADFACREAMLVVELDGEQHYELDGSVARSDADRTAYIQSLGWRVLRFNNRDVLQNTDTVLEEILRELDGESSG